jgi:glycine oxidase
MHVLVIGAGVAGLTCAVELANAGASVEVIDRGSGLGSQCCSWFAGGMLAPWCEGEDASPLVTRLGQEAIAWWRQRGAGFAQAGSLVVAQGRDRRELDRFARRTTNYEVLDEAGIAALEEDLSGRYHRALHFQQEAHIDPRAALASLRNELEALGVSIAFESSAEDYRGSPDRIVDCRGMAARDALPDLRGVKGEMLLVHTDEVQLSRPVRLLHPRIPLYIVPRGQGLYMIGATMIESDDRRRISARSMIELLQGAYALHPAFAEAEVVEIGTDVRPAFPDNIPKIRQRGNTVYVNGFYRHGFLLSPTLAAWTRDVVMNNACYPEVMDEDPMQRPGHANRSHELGGGLA